MQQELCQYVLEEKGTADIAGSWNTLVVGASNRSVLALCSIIASLPLESSALLRLATVSSSSAELGLISTHAGTQGDVHPWRSWEAKALGHLDEVELVYVEDGS